MRELAGRWQEGGRKKVQAGRCGDPKLRVPTLSVIAGKAFWGENQRRRRWSGIGCFSAENRSFLGFMPDRLRAIQQELRKKMGWGLVAAKVIE